MQSRSESSASMAAEENAPFVSRSAAAPPQRREWPVNLCKVLCISIFLGLGVMLGIVITLHMSQYIAPGTNSFLYSSISLCSKSPNSQNPTTTTTPTNPMIRPGRWIRPEDWLKGPVLQHNMSDAELFWIASMAPKRKDMPVQRVPKVAFMFLTRGPLPMLPLWERFFKGHEGLYSIYVHTDPKFKLNVERSSAFYQRQIPSKETKWGDVSMLDAEKRLLANALLDFENERFILLSETCIPLYPFATVYDYLVHSKFSFVNIFDDPGRFGRGRYNPKMAPLVSLWQWRKGSQWFEVNRKLAISIISDDVYYESFKIFCRPACYVDEHYLPTMLNIQHGNQVANRSVTWVDWSRGGAHPAMFGKDDITEEFLTRVRHKGDCTYNGRPGNICFLFARKFSPNALPALLKVSKKALGF